MPLGFRNGLLTGLGLSVAAAFILPRWGRPIGKAAIKGGVVAYESASETLARLRETLEDLNAEVAFERNMKQQQERGAPSPSTAPPAAERPESAEPETVAAA